MIHSGEPIDGVGEGLTVGSKRGSGLPRHEAASVADEYRRRTFAVAFAAKKLVEVAEVVRDRQLVVAPAAVEDLHHARRLLDELVLPATAGPKVRDDGEAE